MGGHSLKTSSGNAIRKSGPRLPVEGAIRCVRGSSTTTITRTSPRVDFCDGKRAIDSRVFSASQLKRAVNLEFLRGTGFKIRKVDINLA
jgi:hypothetical protein